ncbi:hypothetical protein ACGC1H_000306 [Rhizoctonia solani]|uniref:F-box-like domain protein n=1 Tax=Rhizoctonia solani TaxID=456999 RepID=A0A8H2WUH0_9AGAM|nr:unnamed protein product [Rhizoctonia solani]
MIEELRSAGDQLRAAWDTYCLVYSNLKGCDMEIKSPHAHGFPPELTRQLDIELSFLSAYKTKIKRVQAAIGRARNYLSGVAPINNLPPEIITRILHLVRESPCSLHRRNISKSYETQHSSYPSYLAQTCALWRNSAVSSSSLWRHIDLSPYQSDSCGLVARAETYLERAGGLLIELHIAGNEDHRLERPDQDYDNLYELVSRISSRVETLELVVTKDSQWFFCTALRQLLLGPHLRLTKLVIRATNNYCDTFISAEDAHSDRDDSDSELDGSDDELRDFRLNLTEAQIEGSFTPLTTVHLYGIFPAWSSAAYSGLVDLRLMSTLRWSHIKEAELATILKSSPTLQILHFGLDIYDPKPDTNAVTPVNLQDLQVVKIYTENSQGLCQRHALRFLLRLLAPGSKPLRLSIRGHFQPGAILGMEMERFFARSKVDRFYTQVLFPPISLLLRQAVYLEQVVLDNFRCYDWDEIPSTWLGADGLALLPRLRSLHIARSYLLKDRLHLLVEYCPTGIVVYSCDVHHKVGVQISQLTPEELLETFPTVKMVDCNPYLSEDPTADWDILD